jgi:hypothetical protein
MKFNDKIKVQIAAVAARAKPLYRLFIDRAYSKSCPAGNQQADVIL